MVKRVVMMAQLTSGAQLLRRGEANPLPSPSWGSEARALPFTHPSLTLAHPGREV